MPPRNRLYAWQARLLELLNESSAPAPLLPVVEDLRRMAGRPWPAKDLVDAWDHLAPTPAVVIATMVGLDPELIIESVLELLPAGALPIVRDWLDDYDEVTAADIGRFVEHLPPEPVLRDPSTASHDELVLAGKHSLCRAVVALVDANDRFQSGLLAASAAECFGYACAKDGLLDRKAQFRGCLKPWYVKKKLRAW